MKKLIVILLCGVLCLSVLAACGKKTEYNGSWALQDTENYYDGVFGDNGIISVNVEISEENWKSLCDNATAEEYYPADITVNGLTLENVGFRTKGFSSLTTVANSESDRYGFKVKTDKYVEGQTLNGLDMFVLNGSFADASYMREYLTYAAGEYLGTITPFLSYANLSVNGELFGFYIMIEAYDDSFVARNTDDKDAVLYKADDENCTLLTTDTCKGYDVQVGSDKELSNIKKLIEVLNNTNSDNKSELESVFDVDSALKAWAVNTVLGNYDSYSGSKAHNYYLLYENGKFSYIGWDYNMSIGGFSDDNGASVAADVKTSVYNVNTELRPLISKLLAIEEYYDRYIGYVERLCEYFADIENMTGWISDQISGYVKNDPTAFYTYEQFVSNISKTDTDLTVKSGMRPGGQMNPGAQMPQIPGGSETGNFPGGFTPGNNPDGQPVQGGFDPGGQITGENGTMPEPPDGNNIGGGQFMPGQSGDFTPGTKDIPELPSDFDPSNLPDGVQPGQNWMQGGPGGMMQGGGMMNTETCSIVDYVLQRIEKIKTQLSD